MRRTGRSREKRDAAGERRQELSGSYASRVLRVEAAAQAARASVWPDRRMPGAMAESHCDSVGEESQATFELSATCSLEPAISKKHLQEQTGPVQKAAAFPSAPGHVAHLGMLMKPGPLGKY